MPKIKITALYVYPVKSLAGVRVNHLKFDRFGPEFDRRWMIVDEQGNCLTQREITKMALIKVGGTSLIEIGVRRFSPYSPMSFPSAV